jgi:Mn-dependent DtxR family transcriptional regulator
VIEFTRAASGGDEPPYVPLHALSTQQRRIVEIVAAIEEATGEACGRRLLARRLNVHHTTVQDHLAALHRKGWLKSDRGAVSLTRRLSD